MKKLLFPLTICVIALLLSACGKYLQDEDALSYSEYYEEESESEPEMSPQDLLEQETGLQFTYRAIPDAGLQYTIDYQRQMVGNSYLDRTFHDVFEANGKIYLCDNHSWLGSVFFVEVTEEQYVQFRNSGRNAVASFVVTAVSPLPFGYYPSHDYSSYMVPVIGEGGERDSQEMVDEESIYSYIDSGIERVIHGKCLDIYSLQ